jgi:universal stress protein A
MAFETVPLALDREPVAAHAAEVCAEIARTLGAEVALIHVLDTADDVSAEAWTNTELLGVAELQGRNLLAAYRQKLALPEPGLAFVVPGGPADDIVKAAREWPADLIVIGSHGRSGLQRALLGSVAEAVTRHAPCPVLVVRQKG